VKVVKQKKTQISEKSARAYFVMTFCTAILLFFYMELSNKAPEALDKRDTRPGLQKEWKLLDHPRQEQVPKSKTYTRVIPAYPWDERDNNLQIDLQTARDALIGKVPAEKAVGEEEGKLLDTRIVLPPGRVLFWQLRKHVEEQVDVKLIADTDAWSRQPWIISSGKETKLEKVLLQLQNRSGVKHVIMKDHAGEVVLFLIGPKTSD
jgi:hypothetical protein